MTDKQKANQELIQELGILRQRVADLEQSELAHKRAEEVLRVNENRFRALFEQTGVGVAVIDSLTGRFVQINQKYCDIVGYSVEEMLVTTFQSITHPDDLMADIDNMELLREGRIGQLSMEKRYYHKGGDVVWVNLTGSMLWQAGESNIFHIVVVEDITKRKRAEEMLRRDEEEAKRLAKENAIMAEIGRIISSTIDIEEVYERFAEEVRKLMPFDRIMVSTHNHQDQTLTITYVAGIEIEGRQQGGVLPLSGTLAEEVMHRRSGIVVRMKNEREITDRYSALLIPFRAGIRLAMAIPLISKDQVIGSLHFWSCEADAYTQEDQKLAERVATQIAGAIANAQLFDQVKQAEEALRDAETRYRLLFELSPDGIVILDPVTARILEFNETACRQLGYSRAEFARLSISDIEESETPEETRAHMAKVISDGRNDFETRQRTRQGEIRDILVTAQVIEVMRHPVYHCVWRDITDRKRAEKEREKLIHELQSATSQIKTLSGMLPICASCKRIKDDKGSWNQMESYIRDHSEAEFSHGLCPECVKKLYGDILDEKEK